MCDGNFKFSYGTFLRLSQSEGMSFKLHICDFVGQRVKSSGIVKGYLHFCEKIFCLLLVCATFNGFFIYRKFLPNSVSIHKRRMVESKYGTVCKGAVLFLLVFIIYLYYGFLYKNILPQEDYRM